MASFPTQARAAALIPSRLRPRAVSDALPWRPTTIATALVVGVGSVIIAALSNRHWGVEHVTARIAIDTAASIGALAAAWLVRARYRRVPSAMSWFLMTGLAVYAFTAIFAFLIPAGVSLDRVDTAAAPVLGRLVAAVLIACAVFAGSGPMRRPPSLAASIEFVIAVSGACVVSGVVFADRFPALLTRSDGIPDGLAPALVGIVTATAALFAFAGVRLWLRAAPLSDSTVGWLGIGAALMACSRLDAVLIGFSAGSVVTVTDVVRLAATAAFVAAAAAEFRRFEQNLTDAVTADERRRLARDLHDGLAQDLAFVASQASSLARRGGDHQVLREIAYAAERALGDSRRAIHLLNRPRSRALSAALAERAYELCSRAGLQMQFAMLGGEVHATPEVEDGVIQIVSEAISNAAKHSGAETVSVELRSTGEEFAVRVTDDGRGFDCERPSTRRRRFGGFGMTSMAERAQALGGDLHVQSDCERGGTTVEVTFR